MIFTLKYYLIGFAFYRNFLNWKYTRKRTAWIKRIGRISVCK